MAIEVLIDLFEVFDAVRLARDVKMDRIKYLEQIYDYVRKFDGVLHWNGAEILDWYKSAAGNKLAS